MQEWVRKCEKISWVGGGEDTFSKQNSTESETDLWARGLQKTFQMSGERIHWRLSKCGPWALGALEILSGKPPGQSYFPVNAKTLFPSLRASVIQGPHLEAAGCKMDGWPPSHHNRVSACAFCVSEIS